MNTQLLGLSAILVLGSCPHLVSPVASNVAGVGDLAIHCACFASMSLLLEPPPVEGRRTTRLGGWRPKVH